MKFFVLVVIGIGLWVASGCSSIDRQSDDLVLQTDRPLYTTALFQNIEVTADNRSEDTVYYSECTNVVLHLFLNNGGVESRGFPSCDCACLADLPPGKSRTFSISTTQVLQYINEFGSGQVTSVHLTLDFYEDAELRQLLPQDRLRTNDFIVTG